MSLSAPEIHLKPSTSTSTSSAPRVKPAPDAFDVPVPFEYAPSNDGTDENLLVLLHGLGEHTLTSWTTLLGITAEFMPLRCLGDTHVPFAELGKQLRLPQTATLALRAPQQIPYLYEEAFQWYPSFDDLGDTIAHPDPAPGVSVLITVIEHLTSACSWQPGQIHLFGFAQGGSVALEVALTSWKARPRDPEPAEERAHALGSVVSVGGPLLLHHAISTPCATPALVLERPAPSGLALSESDCAALRRVFEAMKATRLGAGESMPASQEEWWPVMEFWSQRLGRRTGEGLYEVLTA
ncbi:hypothetical protein EW145_g8273 [Phellinidium pouzarii]|uniref:Phospholipase/carboxylesterase/thioesterase domain-containing protein n=1 Tax=Phellinidium pouzarii TaxID=167371 RepID=A0A4S4KBZ5_9AGAM|nr:hypothetical protein EW145_g8273 [Phellinidium pouzarii]